MLGFDCSHSFVAAEDSHSPEIAGWGSADLAADLNLDVRKCFHSYLLLDPAADSDRLRSSVVHYSIRYYRSRPD